MKLLKLGYGNSGILLAQQIERVGASHVVFKITIHKNTTGEQKYCLSIRLLHL